MLNHETPINELTVGELLSILNLEQPTQQPQRQYVYGMAGLANLLQCSTVTAQKIKNSGKIPFIQNGRKVVFDVEKVLSALEK